MKLAILGLLPALALAVDQPNFIVIFADDLGYGDLASTARPRFVRRT